MYNMKRIMCPVDFSSAATNAVEYAGNLARDLNAELFLLYIQQVSVWQNAAPMSGGILPDDVEDKAQAALEKLKVYSGFIQRKFKIRCDYAVKAYMSGIEDSLGEEIWKERFDLVVMGTNGAENLRQFFFGSHTYHVIRKTNRPLLMIPEEYAFKGIKKIVYATDYCPEDHDNLKSLLKLTAPYHPELTVLHISKAGGVISEEVFRCFRDLMEDELGPKQPVRFERPVGDDVAGLLQKAMLQADMLVLLTRRYSLIERLFHRSVIRRLSFIAGYPILVYPYENSCE